MIIWFIPSILHLFKTGCIKYFLAVHSKYVCICVECFFRIDSKFEIYLPTGQLVSFPFLSSHVLHHIFGAFNGPLELGARNVFTAEWVI